MRIQYLHSKYWKCTLVNSKRRTIRHPSQALKDTTRKKYENSLHYEEKGTDVNLAIEMLSDALLKKCECVVLVSNDS